jgi:hypothetical protein
MAQNGRKSWTRAKRLKAAKKWRSTFRGKNLVHAYRKRFGVSEVCALEELRMLGVDISDARLEQARRCEQNRATANVLRKQKLARIDTFRESDDTFAFIVDYTEGGAPYGVTWEEMEALDNGTEMPAKPFRGRFAGNGRDVPWVNEIPVMDDDDLPF